MSSPITRTARANQLREAVTRLVKESSWRQAEEVTGVSVGSLQNFVLGKKKKGSNERDAPGIPNDVNMERLEAWARAVGVLDDVSNSASRPDWLPNDQVGQIILDIRTRCSMTQKRFGEEVGGADQAQVSKWEHGHERPPYETLAAIAALDGKRVEIFQEPIRITVGDINPIGRDMVRGGLSLAPLNVHGYGVVRERSAALDGHFAEVRYGIDWPGEPDELVGELERVLTTWVPRDLRTAVRQGSDRQFLKAIRMSFENNPKVPPKDRDLMIGVIDRRLDATSPER